MITGRTPLTGYVMLRCKVAFWLCLTLINVKKKNHIYDMNARQCKNGSQRSRIQSMQPTKIQVCWSIVIVTFLLIVSQKMQGFTTKLES